MAIVEGIKINEKGISFGNHMIKEKLKIDDFISGSDSYTLRTHDKVTRLEKNAELLLETVPGSAVHDFNKSDDMSKVSFTIEGHTNTSITLQLKAETVYRISSSKAKLGSSKSNLSGKINFSLELDNSNSEYILIEAL